MSSFHAPERAAVREAAGRSPARYVPVRSLLPRHRARLLKHLLALDESDRYLRFGYMASDEQIRRYTAGLNFERDEIFGIFNRKLELIAMAHLALSGNPKDHGAEFGVSVLKEHRGAGYGSRLLQLCMLHARNHGVDTLLIHALSENKAMLAVARRVGATVSHEGPDSVAVLHLPPDTLASHMDALVEDSVAELDYGYKLQAKRLDDFLHGLVEIGHRVCDMAPGVKGRPPA